MSALEWDDNDGLYLKIGNHLWQLDSEIPVQLSDREQMIAKAFCQFVIDRVDRGDFYG